jgi:hypothetical protein
MNNTSKIIIIGDINRDILLIPLPVDNAPNEPNEPNRFKQKCLQIPRDGGALFLEETIESALSSLLKDEPNNSCQSYGLNKYIRECKDKQVKENLEEYLEKHKALAMLKLFPKDKTKNSGQVYRLEKLCGRIFDYPVDSQKDTKQLELNEKSFLSEVTKEIFEQQQNQDPDFIVINDKAEFFRKIDPSEWLPAEEKLKNTYFILAMDKPLCEDALWNDLVSKYKERLIIIVSAVALRKAGANIHKTGSAEHIAHDFITHNRSRSNNNDAATIISKLLECSHIIVHLDNDGILHYNNTENKNISIHYCPGHLLKEYSDPIKFGVMAGNTTILTTAIVLGMVNARKEQQTLVMGIDAGIRLATVLAKIHFENGFADDGFYKQNTGGENLCPFKRLFQTDQDKLKKIPLASIPLPINEDELKKFNRIEGLSKKDKDKFKNILHDIVVKGVDTALKDSDGWNNDPFPKANRLCPVAKFGGFDAVDRNEIDSLTDIEQLISKYLQDESWKTPLSIAVFGPPGSGKSFAVKEIFKHITGEKESNPLEFNIAQFTDVADLTSAFHMAQNKALFNNVPLVFFDEFDASYNNERWGWLKYFLAPMQDGIFRGREGSYKVGRAIFIFAGGTSYTFKDFYLDNKDKKEFKEIKGPDFVSRLRGYLNIEGVNSIDSKKTLSDSLKFRRAILLRSILAKKAPQVIDPANDIARIDEELIDAFINAAHYEHGVRSMEAIVQMSLIEKDGMHIASLPTPAQLEMHTDVDSFFNHIPH